MKKAVEENESQAAEASGVSNDLKPGVTVNLSHKNIQKLPDEVVDIIKDQLERYVRPMHPRCCKGDCTKDATERDTLLLLDSPYRITRSRPSLPASQSAPCCGT